MSDERLGEEVRSAVTRQTDGLETRPDEDDLFARVGQRAVRKQRWLAIGVVVALAAGALGGYLIGYSGEDSGPSIAALSPREGGSTSGDSQATTGGVLGIVGPLEHVFTREANGIAIRVYVQGSATAGPQAPSNVMAEMSNDAAIGYGNLVVCGDAPFARAGGILGVGEGAPFAWVMVRLQGAAANATLVRGDFGTNEDRMTPVDGIAVLATPVEAHSSSDALEGTVEAVAANGTVLASLSVHEVSTPPDCSSGEGGTSPVTTPTTIPPADTGTADPAQQEITYAFQHFFDTTLSVDDRIALIQSGEQLRDFSERAMARHREEAAAGSIAVDSIVVSGDQATVQFHAVYAGRESPVNPGQLSGVAVFEDGRWKISRATYCQLAANDGEVCPTG